MMDMLADKELLEISEEEFYNSDNKKRKASTKANTSKKEPNCDETTNHLQPQLELETPLHDHPGSESSEKRISLDMFKHYTLRKPKMQTTNSTPEEMSFFQ